MIHDEAVVRTACGCEKIISIPWSGEVFQTAIDLNPARVPHAMDWKSSSRFLIRRFRFEGRFDNHGRRVFQEQMVDQEDWKTKYLDTYGMDAGL